MPERLQPEPYTLDSFEQMTVDNFRGAEGKISDWPKFYADIFQDEYFELISQHGPGYLLFASDLFEVDPAEDEEYNKAIENKELRKEMRDELGDLLYFGFHAARYTGEPAKKLCAAALIHHTGEKHSNLETFAELQHAAIENADKIKVPNKSTLQPPLFLLDNPELGLTESDFDARYVSLKNNPNYVLLRSVNRIIHSFDPPAVRLTASEIESPYDVRLALGELVLSLAYVSKTRLGTNIEDIALANRDKSVHRKKYGKK